MNTITIPFDDQQYQIFKLLAFSLYFSSSQSSKKIRMSDMGGGVKISEPAVLKQLYDEKLVVSIDVDVHCDDQASTISHVGVFTSYESLDDACFVSGDNHSAPAECYGELYYSFQINSHTAEHFMNEYLSNWLMGLFARPSSPLPTYQKQIAGIVRSIYYVLQTLPANNLFLSEDNIYFSRNQSLSFCVLAYLQKLDIIKVLDVKCNMTERPSLLQFHIAVNKSFFEKFGNDWLEFHQWKDTNKLWDNLHDVLEVKIEFRDRTLSLNGKTKGLYANSVPLELLKFAQMKKINKVSAADFIADFNAMRIGEARTIKGHDDLYNKLSSFRSECRRELGFNSSFNFFNIENDMINLTMIKFGG
ncbi:hypothetical protein KA517_00870 [Candidatus Gracilibacteria bacterium]|nr:hypothetical protein [Candidatus Gracilibacteria bacterium]